MNASVQAKFSCWLFLTFFLTIVFTLFSAITPTYAGFEWIAPEKKTIPKPVPLQNRNPAQTPLNNRPNARAPISSYSAQPLAPMPLLPTRPAQPTWNNQPYGQQMPAYQPYQAPVAPPQQPWEPAYPPAPEPSYQTQYEIVAGFGTDLPLALALSQIVPANYTYSFVNSVNPGQHVSWNGGRPWDVIVQEMLAPLQLTARISGNTVQITNSFYGASDAVSAAAVQNGMIVARQNINNPGQMLGTQPPQTISRMQQYAQPAPMLNGPSPLIPMPGQNVSPPVVPAITPAPDPYANKPAPTSPEAAHSKAYTSAHTLATPSWGNEPNLNQYPQAGLSPRQAQVMTWEAARGASLRDTLEFWARKVNVKLLWRSRHDFLVGYPILINDTFINALKLISTGGINGDEKPLFKLVDSDKNNQADLLIIQDRDS